MKIVIMHSGKGCDTGCCGHVIEIDGNRSGEFHFDHPESVEETRAFAEQLVTAELGAEHVIDELGYRWERGSDPLSRYMHPQLAPPTRPPTLTPRRHSNYK